MVATNTSRANRQYIGSQLKIATNNPTYNKTKETNEHVCRGNHRRASSIMRNRNPTIPIPHSSWVM